MSINTKITLFIFFPHECEAVEEYLEGMAARGWMLKSISGNIFIFKKIEPRRLKYSVDVLHKISDFDHKDTDVALEYRDYCVAAGWKYVCQRGKIQVFYSEEGADTVPIHTEGKEKFKSILKASITSVIAQLIFMFLFVFNIYIQLFEDIEAALSNSYTLVFIAVMVIFAIVTSMELIDFFFWLVKNIRYLKQNKNIRYSNFKRIRIKNLVKGLAALLLIFSLALEGGKTVGQGVSLVGLMFIPIIISIALAIVINKKHYSRTTNIILYVGGAIIGMFLLVHGIGNGVISQIDSNDLNKASDKVTLSLIDFGYKDKSPYSSFKKSIIAEKLEYSSSDGESHLMYTVFKSRYPVAIKLDESMILERLRRNNLGVNLYKSKLPNNITVYHDDKKRNYILVSDNEIVNITKGFNNISEDEILASFYNKFFI
ncbi:DUF2812 domain-containing protein [Clostridium sp. C8-1-8]|uniref:DUF2812 domain-containing protein n=1 Tax=Clostridium sp. C8-1-8 TaxID=2698831 RepID=UPI001FADC80F|nr:DUF2812 domain-containing protein [Clostridium sp. C8-1-8]